MSGYFLEVMNRHYAALRREAEKFDEAERVRLATEARVAQYIANLADQAGFKGILDVYDQSADGTRF